MNGVGLNKRKGKSMIRMLFVLLLSLLTNVNGGG
nr:MAG TPA: hypothetical protein [Caudoviricetes sp.]